jgi:5-methyltetrahydrofolate--homocysteine methyltransferase
LLQAGIDAFKIVNDGLMVGMNEANDKFRRGEFYIPELLMSSRALRVGLDILKPHILERRNVVLGTIVIGTVQFDIHDIGKSMVATLLAAHGFEIVDLGVDVAPKKFIKAIEKQNAKILALSTLLTTTMTSMKATIEQLETSGMRKHVKVIVGGAPVTPVFARNIGADAYCRYGTAAPSIARKLLGIEESAI